MKIAMVGTGYVGLVSGACFADFGHHVTCVDTDEVKIERLSRGQIPIYEPGLDVLVAGNVAVGRLAFTTDLAAAVRGADAVFIAVGTPSRRGDGHADLSYVTAAAEAIAACAEEPLLLVTKSTVPVGTGDEIEAIVHRVRPDLDFDVASNPEFLREGSAIDDFKRPDRVVIGAESERAREVMRLLYRPLFLNETPIVFTSRRTAELTKYAANAFLATKVAFINEIADICERTGANVQDVARGIGLDRRIGGKFLHAGPGFGGSCFPKDTLALVRTADEAGVQTRIVTAVIESNTARKKGLADRIIEACGGSVAGCRLAVLGLSFKPNTDDMRDAPSIDIVETLTRAGAQVAVYDPVAMPEARKLPEFRRAVWTGGSYQAIEGASALVIVTEWDEFRALDLDEVRRLMARPLVIDLRNIYTPEEMLRSGLGYVSIGRPPVPAGQMVTASTGDQSQSEPLAANVSR
jgi:UDPglucose 6-dehydrogenase